MYMYMYMYIVFNFIFYAFIFRCIILTYFLKISHYLFVALLIESIVPDSLMYKLNKCNHNVVVRIVCFCLFVCGLSSQSRIFHSYEVVITAGEELQIFYLCTALMAIEQWRFLRLSHLFYNGHLRWPVILTPIADRLAVELSLHILTT